MKVSKKIRLWYLIRGLEKDIENNRQTRGENGNRTVFTEGLNQWPLAYTFKEVASKTLEAEVNLNGATCHQRAINHGLARR
jgi:hypothetical protein